MGWGHIRILDKPQKITQSPKTLYTTATDYTKPKKIIHSTKKSIQRHNIRQNQKTLIETSKKLRRIATNVSQHNITNLSTCKNLMY